MSQVFNRPEFKDTRKFLRNNSSFAEIILWLQLKGKKFKGLKFRRQQGINAFIVDFYCSELKLAIEVDGYTHGTKDEITRDTRRTQVLSTHGITVIRFSNDEVLDDMDDVLGRLDKITSRLRKA